MTAPRPWTVNRPGPLVQRAPSLWTLDDAVPGLPGATRRMMIVRRADGSLVFFNAVPVPDETLAQITALGRPAALIVPNVFHALDAPAFVERLGVTAYGPDVSVAALRERFPCQPASTFPAGELRVFVVEGFRTKELVLFGAGALMIADLVTNAPHGRGLVGLVMRLVGFTGPAPKLPKPVRKRVETDRGQVQALLHTLAGLEGLARIVPTHGDLIEADCAATLRRVAESLGA